MCLAEYVYKKELDGKYCTVNAGFQLCIFPSFPSAFVNWSIYLLPVIFTVDANQKLIKFSPSTTNNVVILKYTEM